MIDLEKLSQKLQDILNGVDAETQGLTIDGDYLFKFATAGFHLDHIIDEQKGKNFIPCFLEQVGGEPDPVPDLDKYALVARVTMYYPVRFKADFYSLCDFLQKALVGKIKTIDKKVYLFTMDIPTYGELQQLDLKEFADWVENIYQKQIDRMLMYMSMSFNLYLTSADGVIWGNQVKYSMQYQIGETVYPSATTFFPLKWAENGSNVTHEPIGQQLINVDNYSKNIGNITSRSKSYMAYVDFSSKDSTDFWSPIIDAYNNGTTSAIKNIKIKKEYGITGFTYTSGNLLLLDMRENVQFGSPISFVFTLGDAL